MMDGDDDDVIMYDNTGNMQIQEDIVNIEFLFSPIREHYFHNIKTLIKPIFEFEKVNISSVADLILSQREEVGTAIKTEEEEQIGNNDVDILSVQTLINLRLDNPTVTDLRNFILLKINNFLSDEKKELALNIMNNYRTGLLINERAVNLPMQLIPPLLNLLLEDISDYKYDYGNDKYDTDYVVVISKFIKQVAPIKKKVKVQKTENKEEDIYYKFEEEHFVKNSEVCLFYKIPYEQKFNDFQENVNEPQYYNICFISTKKFVEVINFLNK
jgi:protein BCP1